jgi:hypothetical protein
MPISLLALEIPSNSQLTISSLFKGYQLVENLIESPLIAEDPLKIPVNKGILNNILSIELSNNFCS